MTGSPGGQALKLQVTLVCKVSEKVLAITTLSEGGLWGEGGITAIHCSRELLVLSYVNDHVLWTAFSRDRIGFWKNGAISAEPWNE